MRESNGQRFYTSADVSHGKVRDAMRAAADRGLGNPLPLEMLGHSGWACYLANQPAPVRRGHQYGPHRPEDAPVTVTVLGPGKWPKTIEAPLPAGMVKQRARINHLAHLRGSR